MKKELFDRLGSFSKNQKFEALVGLGASKNIFLCFWGFIIEFDKDKHVEMLKRGRARSG